MQTNIVVTRSNLAQVTRASGGGAKLKYIWVQVSENHVFFTNSQYSRNGNIVTIASIYIDNQLQ